LWLANADGTGERALVDADTFAALLSPRFSPDGKWLAFGVHGAPHKALPPITRRNQSLPRAGEDSCWLEFLFTCLVARADAHVAPGALWRVNLDNGKFEQLTGVYDDSPVPA
jgi:Tol biopolymer transport system component